MQTYSNTKRNKTKRKNAYSLYSFIVRFAPTYWLIRDTRLHTLHTHENWNGRLKFKRRHIKLKIPFAACKRSYSVNCKYFDVPAAQSHGILCVCVCLYLIFFLQRISSLYCSVVSYLALPFATFSFCCRHPLTVSFHSFVTDSFTCPAANVTMPTIESERIGINK